MRVVPGFVCLLGLAVMLHGCEPAVYVRLYNATGEQITLVSVRTRQSIRVAPNVSADFSPVYLSGERLLIYTSKTSWTYSLRDLFAPPSFMQHKFITARAYAKIDNHGRIYLLLPPSDHQSAQETVQPKGFPVTPEKN
jgi:hypothetical protein